MRVSVTGASGFIGRRLCAAIAERGDTPVALVRGEAASGLSGEQRKIAGLEDIAGLTKAFAGSDVIVHLAGRAHVMTRSARSAGEYGRVNVEGTTSVARAAAEAGARRFIFLSSIKVNGERTAPGRTFAADDPPAPSGAYAESKHDGEVFLREFSGTNGLELVIIRPPLVYGPGVRGNFRSMMRWLASGIPLPLAAVQNRRSLVARQNLVSLIVTCLDHERASGQTFLVSDGEDLSTPGLLRKLGAALNRPARLFPVPERLLRGAAKLGGKGETIARLCDSLQVDIGKARELLGWSPAVGVNEALAETANDYLAESHTRSEIRGV